MNCPVVVVRFSLNGIEQFRAWSPIHYDFIENKDTALHPMLNADYHTFMERLHLHLHQGLNVYGEVHSIHTDFHSHIPLHERGETAYISLIGSHLSSPVFFSQNTINYYLNRQRELHQNNDILNVLSQTPMPHAFI
jgi:hypothetical protein